MTVTQHIERLQKLIEHGLDPESEVQAWDPDIGEWMPITGVIYGDGTIKIYTDK